MTTHDVTPRECLQLMETYLLAGKVPFLQGPPGLGKSTMMAALAAKYNRPFTDLRLAYYGPTDLGGLPYLDRASGTMKFAPMGLLPTQPGTMLGLDEFPLAARMTQNASLQLVLDRRVGSYILPDDTWVVMAGNRMEDRCFGDKLSPAMINRVVVLRVKPDLEDWVEWAFANEIDAMIVAYVRFNPASLLDFNPQTWNGEANFASPRSWAALHDVLKHSGGLPRDLRRVAVYGTIGPAAGAEFSSYLEVYQELPSFESVILDPEKAQLPEEASAKIAAVAMIANNVGAKTLAPAMTYLKRFEKPFEAFAIKAAVKKDPSLIRTKEVITWCSKNKEVFVA